jgi:hypothetical protein
MIAPLKTDLDEDACEREPDPFAAHKAPPQSSPFEPLLAHLAELQEYVGHYWATQRDAAKAKLRKTLLWVIIGLVAGVVGLIMLATAAALVLIGAADGLGVLFGERFWAGKLAVGLGVVLLALGGAAAGLLRWIRSSRKNTLKQYENRHSRQRARFGRDVVQRARN